MEDRGDGRLPPSSSLLPTPSSPLPGTSLPLGEVPVPQRGGGAGLVSPERDQVRRVADPEVHGRKLIFINRKAM